MRYNLFTEWASFRKTFKFQPIDAVRDYYGVKVALYFAWLGFYTSMVSGRGLCYTVYYLLEGRGFMCFVFYPASVHGPKPKHTKPLPPSG